MNPGISKKETVQYIRHLTTLLTYCWNDEQFVKNMDAERLVDEALTSLCEAVELLESNLTVREKEGEVGRALIRNVLEIN